MVTSSSMRIQFSKELLLRPSKNKKPANGRLNWMDSLLWFLSMTFTLLTETATVQCFCLISALLGSQFHTYLLKGKSHTYWVFIQNETEEEITNGWLLLIFLDINLVHFPTEILLFKTLFLVWIFLIIFTSTLCTLQTLKIVTSVFISSQPHK